MRKFTYVEVKTIFEKEGYSLLSTRYINNKQQLEYVCPKEHKHTTRLDNWIKGHRCPTCAYAESNRYLRLDYQDIKKEFCNRGYILISKEYTNSKAKLNYICPNGHPHSITWSDFSRGHGCPYCSNNGKLLIEDLKTYFNQHSYTLLSEEYINSKTKLYYVCSNGHQNSIIWNDFQQGYRCPTCAIISNSGKYNYNWKGGVIDKKLPLYETYATQLVDYYNVYIIEQDGLELLGVACTYCGSIFIPTLNNVRNRISFILGNITAPNNFYCSDGCKKACPTFKRVKYPKGFKLATSREVQPELRKLVLARDKYRCQICEVGLDEAELHCHHIEAVSQNPIESADIDNCITLCKKHHKQVHTLPDCGYHELKCK